MNGVYGVSIEANLGVMDWKEKRKCRESHCLACILSDRRHTYVYMPAFERRSMPWGEWQPTLICLMEAVLPGQRQMPQT